MSAQPSQTYTGSLTWVCRAKAYCNAVWVDFTISPFSHMIDIWPSLEHRRKNQRLTTMFKIVQGLVAVPSSHLIPADSRTRANHIYKFKNTSASSTVYKNSFFPRNWYQLLSVLTKTLPKRHLWAASRTVSHRPSPLVYSPCWRDIPPREFANYLPDPERVAMLTFGYVVFMRRYHVTVCYIGRFSYRRIVLWLRNYDSRSRPIWYITPIFRSLALFSWSSKRWRFTRATIPVTGYLRDRVYSGRPVHQQYGPKQLQAASISIH